METKSTWRLAVDVGGTFIDYIAMDENTGKVTIDKQPASAGSLVDEFITGLHRLPVAPSELSMFIHGTTVALNTLVQERGAVTGLITTKGFRDVLELNRAGRPEIYDLRYQPAVPLVPRYLRREVIERIGASGEVITPLDMSSVDEEVAFLMAHGVKAIAICLLHSYANIEHESAIAEHIRTNHPDVTVSVSSELVREWREFERTSTTVINAYTQPLFANYAKTIESRVRGEGYEHGIAFVRSNGGVMPIAAAADRPVETLNSGPAGGVIGAHALMAQTGHRNVVCADVGGTTYDVALIHDGEIVERSDTDVRGRPIMGSVIDIISVGAGGGSVASLDANSGSMRVGPESAGASPGPACFGLGGLLPTVTDAQVILNMLDPERFLGNRMVLDRGLAEAAVRRAFGENADVVTLSGGIIAIAQTNMANAIRIMTTQRGLDPRDFAMLSFGGGGGLFAAGVAEELGITEVIVPQAAAGFSAWGMLTADYREDSTITSVIDVMPATVDQIVSNYARLEVEASDALAKYGFEQDTFTVAFSADVRYTGQDHTVTTPLRKNPAEYAPGELLEDLTRGFVARHQQLYGHGDSDAAVQIVTARCRAIAPVARPEIVGTFSNSSAKVVASRNIWFPDGGWNEAVPVYNRDEMSADDIIAGPAVVDEWTTTVIVPPGWNAAPDLIGNLILTKTEDDK